MSTKAHKCPICGDVERSLLPATVCSECGCDMKPVPCSLTVLRGCALPIGHEGRCQAGTTALGNDLLAADVIAALKYLALDKDAPRDSRIAAIRQLAALAALQAERDADKAALEALRGQVAGLVGKWHHEADEIAKNNWSCNANSIRARADELAALLAIKERMG